MFYVYVLYSKNFDRIYIGQTSNISIRIKKHNEGRVKSTKAYIPWEIVYSESYSTRAEAMKREKELKTHRGRDFIKIQILNRQSPAVAGLTLGCRFKPTVRHLTNPTAGASTLRRHIICISSIQKRSTGFISVPPPIRTFASSITTLKIKVGRDGDDLGKSFSKNSSHLNPKR